MGNRLSFCIPSRETGRGGTVSDHAPDQAVSQR
jgi:hypothetical protein